MYRKVKDTFIEYDTKEIRIQTQQRAIEDPGFHAIEAADEGLDVDARVDRDEEALD